MQLHFDRSGVQRLLDHAKQAPHHLPTFRQRKPIGPALWLVGDEGVYLISNGSPPDRVTNNKRFVVYAAEVDPTKREFAEWWEAKGNSFGGDDGIERIEIRHIEEALATYPPDAPLILEVTPLEIAVRVYRPQPTPKSPEEKSP